MFARIPFSGGTIGAILRIPQSARGCVIFANAAVTARFSEKNNYAAHLLFERGYAVLTADLLLAHEWGAEFCFNIPLLEARLDAATDWVMGRADIRSLRIGYFATHTAIAAALALSARRTGKIGAIVARNGRIDLAFDILERVTTPTLLFYSGGNDISIAHAERIVGLIRATVEVDVAPSATHLFRERSTIERIMDLSANWYDRHLK